MQFAGISHRSLVKMLRTMSSEGGMIVLRTIPTYMRSQPVTCQSPQFVKNSRGFCAIVMALLITACQAPAPVQVGSQPASKDALSASVEGRFFGKSEDRARVARDLVSALKQIEGLEPSSTGFTMKPPKKQFERALSQALIDSRYEVTILDDPQGDNVVDYEIKSIADDPNTVTIIVSVDRTRIKRDYRRINGSTKPASSLFVLGANPDNIILDSAIFDDSPPQTKIQTAAADTADAYGSVDLPPIIDVPAITESDAVTTRDTAPATSFAIRAGSKPNRKRNMYETGESNFVEVLKSYQDVDRRILVFANDSMRLGNSNKWFVKTMAKKFNKETDAFSVIGCSFGYTKIKNGNALLALGRAHRIKEELLRNGVPESNILDEGCWSGGENDRDLPSRGVLLVLKRQA